jgi:hypothetical protein
MRAEGREFGDASRRQHHCPQVDVVFGVAIRDKRDALTVGRDSRFGFVIRRLRERHRRLPCRRSGDSGDQVEIPLKSRIGYSAVPCFISVSEDEPPVGRPRWPPLVTTHRGHRLDETGSD